MKIAKKSARAKTAVKSARGKTKTSRRPAVRRPAAGTAIRPVGENGSAEYNAGYNEGFAEGFEAGHRKAYEEDGA